MTVTTIYVGLFFLLFPPPFVTFLDSEWFDGLDNPKPIIAEILPEEVNLFVGERVKIYGVLLDTNASDLQFSIEVDPDHIIELPTTLLNATHVVTILEGNEDLKGRNTLSLYGIAQGSEWPDELSSINFYVLDSLQNVTNVVSTWHYSRKIFEVKWDFAENDAVYVETRRVANDKGQTGLYNCSDHDNTYCRVDKLEYSSILFFHITVKVHEWWWNMYLKNDKYFLEPQVNEFPHYIYEVYPKDKVQPVSPANFKIEGKTSRSFNFTWKSPPYFTDFEESALYRILFKTQDGTLTKTFNSTLPQNRFGQVVAVGDLDPYTFYRVHLQVKPVNGGYWSEQAEAMGLTFPDRPAYGPIMTDTSFLVGTCNEGKRPVILYWTDLKPNETNGELTNFHVKFNSESGQVRYSSNHMKAQLDCNVTYSVEVFSSTEVGLTLSPSRLTIPAESSVLKSPIPVDLKVEKLSESVETNLMTLNVTWAIDRTWGLSSNVSLVLYFCEGQTFSNDICIDDFKYRVAPYENQFIQLHNISLKANRFGYALEQDEDNLSGIAWTDCIYHRNETPRQVSGVIAHPGEKPFSIRVAWSAHRCSKDALALVLLYRVRYCTESNVCDVKDVEGGDSSSYLLTDLDLGETYTITVSAKAFSKEGPVSLPVKSKPSHGAVGDDNSQAKTLGIILGIIGVMVLGGFLFCFMWQVNRRRLKIRKSLPLAKFQSEEKNLGYSDSGISSKTQTSTVQVTNTDSSKQKEELDPSYDVIDWSPQSAANASPSQSDSSANCFLSSSLTTDTIMPPESEKEAETEAIQLELVKPETGLPETPNIDQVLPKSQTIRQSVPESKEETEQSEQSIPVKASPASNSSADDYVIQHGQAPYAHITGVTSDNSSDSSTAFLLNTSYSNSSSLDSTPIVPGVEFEVKQIASQNAIQNSAEKSSGIHKHMEGNAGQCPNLGVTNDALTNKRRSVGSSLSSLNPDSYVIATMVNSNTDQSSSSQSDNHTNNSGEISQTHFTEIPEGGSDAYIQPPSVPIYQVNNQNAWQTIPHIDSTSSASDSTQQDLNYAIAADIGQSLMMHDYGKAADSSTCDPREDNSRMSTLNNNNNNNGNVAQSIVAQPPLFQRKISEDEGISSPGIFTESPRFPLHTVPSSLATFTVLTGSADHPPANNQIVVDITALQNSPSSDNLDVNNSGSVERELLRNENEVDNTSGLSMLENYTNPTMLEINGSSDYTFG